MEELRIFTKIPAIRFVILRQLREFPYFKNCVVKGYQVAGMWVDTSKFERERADVLASPPPVSANSSNSR